MTEPKQISVMAAMKMAYSRKAIVTRNAGTSMIQKRIGLFIVALFLSAGTAVAQGTIMPPPIFTGLDSSGNPLVSGKLCTYVAGTSTPATTYTSSALSPGATNTNPVILDAAGRATVFLRPGQSYKFALYSAGSDQTCATGTLQWTQDNISAVPTSNVNLDLTGTAGESLATGDAVCLSEGSGGRTAGSWYKADADLTYCSSEAPAIGMVPAAIASGASGTIRISGLVDVTGPLTPGTKYWVSATAGAITATAPTNARQVGVGYTSTSILVAPSQSQIPSLGPAYVINAQAISDVVCGRITLTTAVPVTVNDVTAATTVYYTPYNCNSIALYNTTSTVWQVLTFAELSIALGSDTTSLPYDVFAYINSGAVAIERLVWTNTTTRATALTTQNGILVKTGDASRRYLGTYYTTGAGQTEDSAACRCVWNYYNRVRRHARVLDVTNTWSIASANTWQQARASTTNQIAVVTGVQETQIALTAQSTATEGGATGYFVSIGAGSATTPSTEATIGSGVAQSIKTTATGSINTMPAVGYSTWVWLERATTNTITMYGDDNTTGTAKVAQSGIFGWVES